VAELNEVLLPNVRCCTEMLNIRSRVKSTALAGDGQFTCPETRRGRRPPPIRRWQSVRPPRLLRPRSGFRPLTSGNGSPTLNNLFDGLRSSERCTRSILCIEQEAPRLPRCSGVQSDERSMQAHGAIGKNGEK
jgi:hypothetical protein